MAAPSETTTKYPPTTSDHGSILISRVMLSLAEVAVTVIVPPSGGISTCADHSIVSGSRASTSPTITERVFADALPASRTVVTTVSGPAVSEITKEALDASLGASAPDCRTRIRQA